MSYQDKIDAIEFEWSPDSGFFWSIRQGHFTTVNFERALAKLSSMSIEEDAAVPLRLISLLWYIPLFMQWQVERVQKAGGSSDAYVKAITTMTNEVERLLGVP